MCVQLVLLRGGRPGAGVDSCSCWQQMCAGAQAHPLRVNGSSWDCAAQVLHVPRSSLQLCQQCIRGRIVYLFLAWLCTAHIACSVCLFICCVAFMVLCVCCLYHFSQHMMALARRLCGFLGPQHSSSTKSNVVDRAPPVSAGCCRHTCYGMRPQQARCAAFALCF